MIHLAMILIVNFWFMLVCSTDPGIIPARTWQNCKQEIARHYQQSDKRSKLFYHMTNMQGNCLFKFKFCDTC